MNKNELEKKNRIFEFFSTKKTTSFASLLCIMAFGINTANAQVGMMTNNPHKSAVLDLSNTNKGLLIPRIGLNSLTDKASINGADPATSLMVFNTNASLTGGTGFYYWDGSIWKKMIASGDSVAGDNLGNHTATQDLNMANNNINAANNITANGKTTTNTAQISKGINNASPLAGYIATAADASGNINWISATAQSGSISGVYEAIGSNETVITSGNISNLTQPYQLTFTLTKPSYVLITYSALGLPNAASAPTQGSIDLMVNGTKQISSYFSAWDAPSGLVRLGNYSTAQKMISLDPGTYSINVQAKCWFNAVKFNTNPVTSNYIGSLSTDTQAMTTRVTAIVFNK